jgi:hypothetical protein
MFLNVVVMTSRTRLYVPAGLLGSTFHAWCHFGCMAGCCYGGVRAPRPPFGLCQFLGRLRRHGFDLVIVLALHSGDGTCVACDVFTHMLCRSLVYLFLMLELVKSKLPHFLQPRSQPVAACVGLVSRARCPASCALVGVPAPA